MTLLGVAFLSVSSVNTALVKRDADCTNSIELPDLRIDEALLASRSDGMIILIIAQELYKQAMMPYKCL